MYFCKTGRNNGKGQNNFSNVKKKRGGHPCWSNNKPVKENKNGRSQKTKEGGRMGVKRKAGK